MATCCSLGGMPFATRRSIGHDGRSLSLLQNEDRRRRCGDGVRRLRDGTSCRLLCGKWRLHDFWMQQGSGRRAEGERFNSGTGGGSGASNGSGASLAASASTRRCSAASNYAGSAGVANRVVPSMFGGFVGQLRRHAKKWWCTNRGNARTTFCWGRCWGRSERITFMRVITKRRGPAGITLLTLGFGSPMSWLWAVIDICTIDRDGWGVQFES